MPWSETSTMDQKTQFIADYLREVLSVTELCELYGISRKTGYKWIDRYIRSGPEGLEEESYMPLVPESNCFSIYLGGVGNLLPTILRWIGNTIRLRYVSSYTPGFNNMSFVCVASWLTWMTNPSPSGRIA